jgi:mono/diheme cytochrome c family protein
VLTLVAGGCLSTFVPDPTSSSGPVESPADLATAPPPSEPPPSGAPPSAPPSSAPDAAMAPPPRQGDLGLSPEDLAGPANDLALACDKTQSTASLSDPTGHHRAGQECQGCHAPGRGAPTFYLGGTLYSAVSGGTAVAGATLNVVDGNGKAEQIISAANGNFWYDKGTLAFPLRSINASLCPATVPMVSTDSDATGACNNCHGSALRVHVP